MHVLSAMPVKNMKILYALANHPQLSEMYVESEIRFAEISGIECAAWSKRPPGAAYPVSRKVYTGTLEEAERDFAPDLVHFHWLTLAESHVNEVKAPITVRGHSFDFKAKRIQDLTNNEKIKALFLFPHQAKAIKSAKVIPLNVGFDSTRYHLTPNKDRRQVVRCCAARPSKGLNSFIQIAKLCPDFVFNICVAEVHGDNKFVPQLMKDTLDSGVIVRVNVQPPEMAALMCSSGISLHTLDLPQSVGMCISVAEGMGCGNYSLTNDVSPLKEMISGVGDTYKTNEQAAKLINDTKAWDDAKWDEVHKATESKALEFADFNVFPTLISYWKSICG